MLALVFVSGVGGGLIYKNLLCKDSVVSEDKQSEQKTTTTTIVKNKDGSSTTTIVEKSKKNSEITKKKEAPEKKYRVGFMASKPIDDLKANPEYSVTLGAKTVGDLWVDGIYNFTSKEVGIGLSIQF